MAKNNSTGIRQKIVTGIREFIGDSRAVGITLLVCTITSMVLANSSLAGWYHELIETKLPVPAMLHLPHNVIEWINDGLMAAFFFLVGMEIKKQLLDGELSSVKNAVLPIAGALGGMLVPAMIFLLINRQQPYHNGWGIPMATDIAFSLGVASLLGKKVPLPLKIFLMALAIIDDLGAIIVIAIFYGGEISWLHLLYSAGLLTLTLVYTKWVRFSGWLLIPLAIGLWYFVFNSGIHATIAGVLLALVVPLDRLDNYIHRLHDSVSFIILPLFALANTAIHLPDNWLAGLTTPLSIGVFCGLVIGKPLGIGLLAWMVVRLGWAALPEGVSWWQLIGMAVLAGIGFTMSIFITLLAFTDIEWQDISKLAILLAGIVSVLLGLLILQRASVSRKEKTEERSIV